MRILIAIAIAAIATACTPEPLEAVEPPTFNASCAALAPCPDVGCPLPHGPFGSNGYLWCEIVALGERACAPIAVDVPCYCTPPNGGAYTWCQPSPEQIEF